MKNKKGLSTIVATLIIILLVLVAVGIIWVVVRNVIMTNTGQVDIGTKCILSQVVAKQVTAVTYGDPAVPTNTTYRVTLERTAGDDQIGGVSLVFTDATEQNTFIVKINSADVSNGFSRLGIVTKEVEVPANAFIGNATKIGVVIFYDDEDGVDVLCSSMNSLQFAA
ncbi:MAG TPA: hypothetical protein PK357_01445 [Candidatus Pacearchaeota archaeon]|nr:hypothetical protein [Candidatus Pacearchaeota archaeon]